MGNRTRKSIAAGATALFAASGIMAIAPTAVAQAQADTENCATSQTETFSWGGSAWTNYHVTKEVVGNGTAAPGGEVTFHTTINGAGGLITRIEDYHPEGFELVRARESVWKVLGGQSWATVTDDVRRDSADNMVSRAGSGWTTAGGAYITLETTYRVPDDATVGDVYNTGAGFDSVLVNGHKVANPINTCVTIREPNAAEQMTGSLDNLGLGSATDGSTASSGISSDPSGFISDIISGVDIGEMIGLS